MNGVSAAACAWRVAGGLILSAAGILNMGLFLKIGSMFVVGLTGMSLGVELKIVMTVLLALVLFYTIMGGMISVVVTDYVQFVVLSIGLLAACGFAVWHVPWPQIIDGVRDIKDEAGFNPFHADSHGATYVVWMVFVGLIASAVWPTAVMRACAAADERVVRRLYVWSSIGFLIRFMVPYFLAICALVYISKDVALAEKFIAKDGSDVADAPLMALPVFLGQILPAGVIGIVAAGMLAAFMSTHDSYLLCWSSVLTQDVVAPCFRRGLSTKVRLVLARLFIFLIGLFLLGWGLWYAPQDQAIWEYMAVTGAIYFNGAFTLLLLGIYWKRASRAGAYAGLLCGCFAVVGLKPVSSKLGLTDLVNAYGATTFSAAVGLITAAAALVMMALVSLVVPDRGKTESGTA